MTTQELFGLQKLNTAWTGFYDDSKPYYNVSVRNKEENGPWVTLVATNEFAALVRGYTAVHLLMCCHAGMDILVERLVRDEEDHCKYHTTHLEQGCPHT